MGGSLANIYKKFYTVFFCLVVVSVNLLIQSTCDLPIVVDEIGYISYPALIAGYKWNDVLNYVPYYGFGFGLLLIPIFGVCHTIKQIYIAIRVFHYLLIVIIFLTIRKLGDEVGEEKGENNLFSESVYSLFCCIIPSILVFKCYALSEILIITVYLLILLTLNKYIKSRKMQWKIFFIILNLYFLMIHLRTVGVVFLSLVFIIFLDRESIKKCITNKKNRKIFVFIGLILIVLLTGFIHVAKWIEIGKYDNTNSIVSQIGRIIVLFNFERMKSFLLLIGSRIWTYIVSYLGLTAIGMGVLVSSAKNENKKIYLYMILSFVLEFTINCVTMSAVGRLDMIFYTRYSEFCIIPILYFGIKKICESEISIEKIFIIMFITLCTYQFVHYLLNANKQISDFLTICVPNVSIWWKNGEFSAELATKMTILFLFSIYIFSNMKRIRLKVIPLFLITIIWVSTASNAISNYEKTLDIQKYSFDKEVKFISDNDYQKIYAVVGTKEYYIGRHYECWLQLAVPNMEIQCIPIEDCYNYIEDKNAVIIIPKRLMGLDEKIYEKYFQCKTEYFYFLGE